jgi:uncharacterized membrane protein
MVNHISLCIILQFSLNTLQICFNLFQPETFKHFSHFTVNLLKKKKVKKKKRNIYFFFKQHHFRASKNLLSSEFCMCLKYLQGLNKEKEKRENVKNSFWVYSIKKNRWWVITVCMIACPTRLRPINIGIAVHGPMGIWMLQQC